MTVLGGGRLLLPSQMRPNSQICPRPAVNPQAWSQLLATYLTRLMYPLSAGHRLPRIPFSYSGSSVSSDIHSPKGADTSSLIGCGVSLWHHGRGKVP